MVTHDLANKQVAYLLDHSPESILVIAQEGGGIDFFAAQYVSELQKEHTVRLYDYTAGPEYGIDEIRELWIELGRKPASKQHLRVILIRSAQLLHHEAQTALLKSIEEPPALTRILLLTSNEEKILPTVRSRVHIVRLAHPTFDNYKTTYSEVDSVKLRQYYALSGGLPELIEEMINGNNQLLDTYISTSKSFLSASMHARLCQVEPLLKNKELDVQTFLLYLLRITRSTLMQTSSKNDASASTWLHKSVVVLKGLDDLKNKANPKLVLSYIAMQL